MKIECIKKYCNFNEGKVYDAQIDFEDLEYCREHNLPEEDSIIELYSHDDFTEQDNELPITISSVKFKDYQENPDTCWYLGEFFNEHFKVME